MIIFTKVADIFGHDCIYVFFFTYRIYLQKSGNLWFFSLDCAKKTKNIKQKRDTAK